MSRSQPNEIIPNPATRWFEWSGSGGHLKYYDKNAKQNVDVELPFQFILLDQLSVIKGWHDDSEAGIYSNEVRDTRDEPFIVKSFKMKEPIAEGFYSNIKDRVKASGGHYVANCYIAFTDDREELALGSLQFHGAALREWMGWSQDKTIRSLLYKNGIRIYGSETGKKGGITFKVPKFELVALDQEMNDTATGLDVELQKYLRSYFGRTRVEQAAPAERSEEDEVNAQLQEEGLKPDDEIDF